LGYANIAQFENQLILTYHSEDKEDGRNVYLTLKPGEQRAFFLSELLGWGGSNGEMEDQLRGT
jgi:hypothetical protein